MSIEKKYFLPYQVKWILDKSRLKIIEKSRQIGMSYTTAYSAVRRAADPANRNDLWVTSRDDTQAKLFLEDCKSWTKPLKIAAADLGLQVLGDKESAYVLEFATGRRIHSLSSNPNALAGKRGHVIIDEFALHKDQRLLYRIAKPVTMWGGQLELISTHRGVATVFNEIIRDVAEKGNPMGWSHHRVTVQDAVDQGLCERIGEKTGVPESRPAFLARLRAECLDEEQWLQEYCCVPSDDSSAFLSYELIVSCEYPVGTAWKWETQNAQDKRQGQVYIGVDVGREHDLTVIWVIEKLGDVNYTRAVVTMHKETFEAQENELAHWMKYTEARRCCIDCTGIGRQFSERAQQRFGKYRVEAVNFSQAVKEELAYPVRAAFEDKTLRVPNNADIRADLRAIKKETTASGNIRFTADHGKNGHADRFWALALALHAGKRNTLPTITVC